MFKKKKKNVFPNYQSLNLFCPKREKESEMVLCVDDEKLYCDTYCCHGFGNRTAVPLCLCAGKGNCSRNRFATE